MEMKRKAISNKLAVFFPTSIVAKAQEHRGVGRYGQWLQEGLRAGEVVEVVDEEKNSAVVHYLFFDLWRASLRKVHKEQRLIVTVHDLIPLLFPEDYPVGWRGKINFWRQKMKIKKADLIVTDSNSSKRDISQKLKIKEEKIRVVYLAANPNLETVREAQIKSVLKSYGVGQEYLLYVGDINFNKNLTQLIKALKFLPKQIQLVLLGKNFFPQPIPEWQVIREQIDLSEVAERVKFLTTITSDSELSAFYSGALAYVQPSYYEGFGLPVLEAMRCRTPVICGKNSSLPEVAGEWAFYTVGLRAEDLVEQIEKVRALSAGARDKWVEAGYKWQEKFSWQKTVKEMEEIYREVSGSIRSK
jgi:glycosyltransferase involved in cell wall biosynthesis